MSELEVCNFYHQLKAASMSSSFLNLCDSLVQILSVRTGVGIMRG